MEEGPTDDARGEAALVTGGASGLGRATAVLAYTGARRRRLDHNAALAEKTVHEFDALPVSRDGTSEETMAAAIRTIRETHGIVRICVNCMGVNGSQRLVNRSDWRIPLKIYVYTDVESTDIRRHHAASLAARARSAKSHLSGPRPALSA